MSYANEEAYLFLVGRTEVLPPCCPEAVTPPASVSRKTDAWHSYYLEENRSLQIEMFPLKTSTGSPSSFTNKEQEVSETEEILILSCEDKYHYFFKFL